ncbi:hypothetical protein MEQU1_002011 [Malassezia equina]|uniref:Glycoside hydrolase family 5 C-terminal domain-containing protein n=1 Tax=Malassezia equina TaxID=1381935 RepID=A0AAF0EBJ0_9BASI|nr:hypothetical protein MEQU1_002011 [Malassezia equina]
MAAAHDLSDSALGGPIQIHDSRLTDTFGRTLLLRGVNIGGASKLYYPIDASYVTTLQVWDWDEEKNKPVVLQADYFDVDPRPGFKRQAIEWYKDFYAPFALQFQRSVNVQALSRGIPYDVNESLQKAPGNYHSQTILMDALISALERNWVSFTLWNYNPSNTVARGDMWNMEDFSIINQEAHARDLANWYGNEPMYSGGRGLPAIIRPYASKVADVTPEILVSDEKQTVYIVTDKNEPGVVHSVQIRVPSNKTLHWIYVFDENPLLYPHEMSEEKCALSKKIAPTLNWKARA